MATEDETAPAKLQLGGGQGRRYQAKHPGQKSSAGHPPQEAPPRRHRTNEEWVAWLTGPLPLADRLAIEIDAARDAARDPDAIEAGARTAEGRDDALARHAAHLARSGAQQIMRGESQAQLADKRGEPHQAERARFHERRIAAELTHNPPTGRTA